jgi:hypothetical protein
MACGNWKLVMEIGKWKIDRSNSGDHFPISTFYYHFLFSMSKFQNIGSKNKPPNGSLLKFSDVLLAGSGFGSFVVDLGGFGGIGGLDLL